MTTVESAKDAILQDIIANPEDDGLRLIYADWLEDNGDGMDSLLAEFIRIQCRIAQMEIESGHPKTTPLAWSCKCDVCVAAVPIRKREAELLPLISSYTPYIVPDPSIVLVDWAFRRGFIHAISCEVEVWLNHGKTLCNYHPLNKVDIAYVSPMDDSTWGRNDSSILGLDVANLNLPQPLHRLPRVIWDSLENYDRLTTGHLVADGPNNKHYTGGRTVAMEALSKACLKWARS